MRGHSGDLLNDRADALADRGTRGESASRRRTRWRDVEAAVDALRATHLAIGTHAIKLPPQTIYQLLLDVHQVTVSRMLPELPRARLKKAEAIFYCTLHVTS